MMDDINKKLPAIHILKKTYLALFQNIKPYLILSYMVMLPLFIVGYLFSGDIDLQQTFPPQLIIYFIFTITLLLFFSIFLFRLFMLGTNDQYKITMVLLTDIFLRSFLYSAALLFVLMVAIMSVGLLFAIVLLVINSVAGENAMGNAMIINVVSSLISAFLLLIIMRTQPTFISIALGEKTMPMRSAYYYTRDNNWNLLVIGLLCTLPAFAILMMLRPLIGANGGVNYLLLFLISPLNLLPFALHLCAASQIFKHLVPKSREGHTLDIKE